MKENFTIYNLITFLAAVAFFAPLGVLLYKKLARHPFFSWFAIYWAFSGLVNLLFLSDWLPSHQSWLVSDIVNYTDGVLMLFILYKTLDIPSLSKRAGYIVIVFLALSVTGMLIRGFSESIVIVIGVAIALIFLQLVSILIHYLRSANKHHVGSSRLLLYYGLFFEYGTSILTYIFSYMFPKMNVVRDSFLLFHISIIISTTFACFAIALSTRHRSPRRTQSRVVEREAEIQFL